MKVAVQRLSCCACGFPAFGAHIKLGKEYDVLELVKTSIAWTCGGCGKKQSLVGLYTRGHDGQVDEFLPEILFKPKDHASFNN